NATARLRLRNTLYAMHARFMLQLRVDLFALHERDGFLYAADSRLRRFEDHVLLVVRIDGQQEKLETALCLIDLCLEGIDFDARHLAQRFVTLDDHLARAGDL